MNNVKIIKFEKFCSRCEHKDTEEKEKPCRDCLAEPARVDNSSPLYFKEKE